MKKDLFAALAENFTVANLGCIGDEDFSLPPKFLKSLTVIEVDAEGGARTRNPYHRKIQITAPINATAGKHPFIRYTFAGTCSLLRPRSGKVEEFAMQQYFEEVLADETECETLPDLLQRNQVATLDFLKTDVEGLDSAIIRSCEKFLGQTLCLQAELRFNPFYETEPPFHETVSFLAVHGYEVLDILHIDRWKYCMPNWKRQLQGRAVWADFLFFLKPEKISANFGEAAPLAVAKQIILATMLGKKNYGEFLLQRFGAILPAHWKKELQMLVQPRWPNLTQARQSFRRIFMPLELFLKHRINRSRHVSIRQGN
jgi:FkbM family methyltransferase